MTNPKLFLIKTAKDYIMSFDPEALKLTLVKRGQEEQSVWPSITVSLYSSETLAVLGPYAANALEAFVNNIPTGVLKSAHLDSGDIGKFTKQRFNRDLKLFRQPPSNETVLGCMYSSSGLGPPNDFGVYITIIDLTRESYSQYENLLRIDLPASFSTSPEKIIELVKTISANFPISSGVCGWGLSHWYQDRFAVEQTLQILPRYIGFEHSSPLPLKWQRGKLTSPSWLTILPKTTIQKLGGEKALLSVAPKIKIIDFGDNCIIRAAYLPIVGDKNRAALDVGNLPGVAAFTKPLRAPIPFLRANRTELNTAAWLARFDDMPNRPWDNR